MLVYAEHLIPGVRNSLTNLESVPVNVVSVYASTRQQAYPIQSTMLYDSRRIVPK